MRLEGSQWDVSVLSELGRQFHDALTISTVADDDGKLTGYEVSPDFDIARYDAMAAKAAKDKLKGYAASKRYELETAGVSVTVGGKAATMSTARDDRDGARDTLLAIDQGWRKDGAVFKFASGPLAATNDEMKAAIGSAFAHVQAVYDAEGKVSAKIDSGSIKTEADVDAAEWPTKSEPVQD